MKANNKRTALEAFMEFWEDLSTSRKVAFCWVASVAVILLTLGIIYPIFGLVLFCIVAVIGFFVAITHLLIN